MRIEEKKIICIICPLGCDIIVCGEVSKSATSKSDVSRKAGKIISIEGHKCKRGELYATDEFLAPLRIFTSSVRIIDADSPLLPVRSRDPIPKELLLQCVEQLRGVELQAPVGLYDVVIPNILGTGVDIIATASVPTHVKSSTLKNNT
ncbi:MAG: DUF1667 domain-containing protein [Spirochaetes bacterium]|nr:DUF1667 domain-containing protein [Spirochaetota bacterium]